MVKALFKCVGLTLRALVLVILKLLIVVFKAAQASKGRRELGKVADMVLGNSTANFTVSTKITV
jgi:hypothetical protein